MSYERDDMHKTLLLYREGSTQKPKYTIGRMVKVRTGDGRYYMEALPNDFELSPDLWYFDAFEIVDGGTAIQRQGLQGEIGLTHVSSGNVERLTS